MPFYLTEEEIQEMRQMIHSRQLEAQEVALYNMARDLREEIATAISDNDHFVKRIGSICIGRVYFEEKIKFKQEDN